MRMYATKVVNAKLNNAQATSGRMSLNICEIVEDYNKVYHTSFHLSGFSAGLSA